MARTPSRSMKPLLPASYAAVKANPSSGGLVRSLGLLPVGSAKSHWLCASFQNGLWFSMQTDSRWNELIGLLASGEQLPPQVPAAQPGMVGGSGVTPLTGGLNCAKPLKV